MNNRSLFVFILVLISPAVISQKSSHEFGVVGKEEVDLKMYAQDKNAEAVVIFDKAESYFVNPSRTLDVIFERTTRIKIFEEAGLKYAEFEIPYYREGNIFEEVYEIEAITTYYENLQIKKISLDVTNSYDEKINEYWSVKKIALPNIEVGSIIDIRYKILSPYIINLRDWEFQWRIPVIYSEYMVKMTPFYEYSWFLQGANNFDFYNSYIEIGSTNRYGETEYEEMVHQYVMKDVPAFPDEKFITSINNYIIKIDFQLSYVHQPGGATIEILTSWEDIIKELSRRSDFGKNVKKSEKTALDIPGLGNISQISNEEIYNTVLNYVKSNYSWNGYMSKYASKSVNRLIDDKIGNCADINLFTVGLLKRYGIDAYPVLISTRDHGRIKYDFPVTDFFNYVLILAKFDDNMILTDATEKNIMNNRIPPRCINDKGLVIDQDQVLWVNLMSHFPSATVTYIEIKFEDSLNFNSDLSKILTEYEAVKFRNSEIEVLTLIKENYNSNDYNVDAESMEVRNLESVNEPVLLNYTVQGKSELISNQIYIKPFLNEISSDNPFKKRSRTFPIDITYPLEKSFETKLIAPPGYVTEYLPKDFDTSNELFELHYSIDTKSDTIECTLEYQFKRSVYSPKDYTKIKGFFSTIAKKGNEKISFSRDIKNDEKSDDF